ncbi:MAG: acyl-CoA dehydrogenase, partial [Bacteroidales bacterium]|nr:acyl-CoA dehydrogenase [Bacteroidales bacterium]
FTPICKGMTSEYANQNAYDAISVHGGSGFIMEYKCQRLFRDARIFSIYEGTTQLQVVAAIRYITNGTYLGIIREMLEAPVSPALEALKARVARMADIYEESVNYVKDAANQELQDFLARRLYDMTGEIVMSLLLLADATKAPELFEKSANVFVRMAEENVLGKSAYVKNFVAENLASFRAVEPDAE